MIFSNCRYKTWLRGRAFGTRSRGRTDSSAFILRSSKARKMSDLPNGHAPIKSEYRVAIAATTAPVVTAVGVKRDAPDDDTHSEATAATTAADGPQARQKQRGMNKQRKHFRPEQSEMKMCVAILSGDTCKWGDGCKFSHDLAAYAAQRPADLGETCPIYTLRGECRFGASCRFGTCHIDAATGAIEDARRDAGLRGD